MNTTGATRPGRGLAMLTMVVIVGVGVRLWPHPPLRASVPVSTAVYDADGRLLRLTLADDGQFRLWTPLTDMAPALVEATLLYEDRHFFRHPGVNPVALARAALATYGGAGRRIGGSTITMQLVRRLAGVDSRTVSGKLQQMATALWLELRHGKREILEAYLNLAPYGGNVEGIGAASLIYFHKPAAKLLPADAVALAVIPQNPTRRGPGSRAPDPQLGRAREALLAIWRRHHAPQAADVAWAATGGVHGPAQLPFEAPHFVEDLLADDARSGRSGGHVHSTLDGGLQKLVERHLRAYVTRQRRLGIRNASAMLVDARSMEIRALVGSAGFFDEEIAGQVDGTAARRSPGSTLKPLVYALGMDQGLIHPRTMLRDVPAAFGAYSPENFDGRYAGPLSAQDALTRSRNIPALELAGRLTAPGLYEFLRGAGVPLPQPAAHYGLGLALGTGEVTMRELVILYAMLSNGGVLRPLRVRREHPLEAGTRLLSEESAFLVTEMLASSPRPTAHLAGAEPPGRARVAWKTGTSWAFRDAWTVGVFGPYVLAVWIGNFSGESNPAFVGVQAAAPLFFEIVDSMQASRSDLRALPPPTAPAGLRRVGVCALSGGLPSAACPHQRTTWFIPGRSPPTTCTIHRRVDLDARGHRTCPAAGAPIARTEVYEVWPSDMARLFAAAGLPRRSLPPAAPACEDSEAGHGAPPRITSPLLGVTYQVRAGAHPQGIALQATVDGDAREVFWFIDESFIGRMRGSAPLFWAPATGRFVVRAVDDLGRSAARTLLVESSP